LKVGASEDVDRPRHLLLSALADLSKCFIDCVLDRLGTKPGPRSAKRLIVDVYQVLAHGKI
jgi:hypothetical protein